MEYNRMMWDWYHFHRLRQCPPQLHPIAQLIGLLNISNTFET